MMSATPSGRPEERPTVFISYAHESDALRGAVKALADWLNDRGCTVWTDHPYTHRAPRAGWTTWMENCIEEADVVLVVCTPKLKERYAKNSPPEMGAGATFEGAILTQHLYDLHMLNSKFFPIIPDDGSYDCVPTKLRNWWNGHRFPSGYEGIRCLIFDEPGSDEVHSAGGERGDEAAGWAFDDKRHEALTARRLGATGARRFLDALVRELEGQFALDHPPTTPSEIARWFAQAPADDDAEAVRVVFDVVHRALIDLEDAPEVDAASRQEAEKAAATLYCLAACHLVDRTAHAAGRYVLHVPVSESVVYAVIATALFGGELHLTSSERADLPRPEYIFDVHLPAGGHLVDADFERAAYIALFPYGRATTSAGLDVGPLDANQRGELAARLRTLKRRRRVSFALVVHGAVEGKSYERFARTNEAPVMIPDEAGRALLRVDPAILRAEIREFWSALNVLKPAKPEDRRSPPFTDKTPPMYSSGFNVIAGDGATIAVSTGESARVHAERREGIGSTQLIQVLRELLEAIEAQPGPDVRRAVEPHVKAVKNEMAKDTPDPGNIQKALDGIEGTVKRSAGILEGGEKIAGLLHRAYQYLSPFLGLP